MRAGITVLDANIRTGTLEYAQWLSYSTNQSHGLRRTNDDKRRAVEKALQHPKAEGMGNGPIADHCGVSEMFVSKMRSVLKPTLNGLESRERTGRDGRTINTANIGR